MATQEQLKQEVDILIVNVEEDEAEAQCFRDFLQSLCSDVKIWTLHGSSSKMVDAKIDAVERCCGRILFYITQKFCQNVEYQRLKEKIILSYMRKGLETKFIPVLTQSTKETDSVRRYEIPFLLKSVAPIRLFRLTKGERISALSMDAMRVADKWMYDEIVKFMNSVAKERK